MFFLYYLRDVLIWTGQLLWAILGPFLLTALLMQLFSNLLRSGFVKLFGLKAFIYLLAPGVMVHELGHALFCFPFRHRIVEMKMFSPQKDGTLGWVKKTYDPNSYWAQIGNFFIGTGPVWLGLTVLYLLTNWLLPVERFDGQGLSAFDAAYKFMDEVVLCDEAMGFQWFIWAYLTFAIGANITLSMPDIEGAWMGFCVIAFSVFAVCLVTGGYQAWPSLAAEAIKRFTGNVFYPMLTLFAIIGISSFTFWFIASLLTIKKKRRRR